MGCDIHLFVEAKKNTGWEVCNPPKTKAKLEDLTHMKDPENWIKEYPYDGLGYYWNYAYSRTYGDYDTYEEGYLDKGEPVPWRIGRDYDLFAMLADVRNGRGFAGCKTGEGFNVIAKPKGLPTNASLQVVRASNNWGIDGHSHSWLTLDEIKKFDWNQITTHYGHVGIMEYLRYKKDGKPTSWSGGVGGGSIKIISNEEMDKVIEENQCKLEDFTSYFDDPYKLDYRPYTVIKWQETYKECCPYFLNTVIPEIEKFGNDEEVRIVFWFDN